MTAPRLYAAGVTGGLLLIILAARVFVPGLLTSMLAPLWGAGASATAGVASAGSVFGSKATLMRERDRAIAERDALANQNAALQAQVRDVTRLVGDRTEPAGRILAGVLARPPVSPYDVLVVDQGADQGAKVGALAYAAGGVPVGTVASVTGSSARVLLFSSPGRETAAWAGTRNVAITLKGQGSGAFAARVPREAGLVAGDTVSLAGGGALPVGTIVHVADDPSSPESLVSIRPFVNPFSLSWVELSPGALGL